MIKFLKKIFSFFSKDTYDAKTIKLVKSLNSESIKILRGKNILEKKDIIFRLDSALGIVLNTIYGKDTVGNNLKKAKNLFPKGLYQSIWDAHKIRNTLAHDPTYRANNKELNVSIKTFLTTFQELKLL